MTKDNKDKINKQLTQIKNVSILMKTLFTPVAQHMRNFHCDQTEAIDRIDKAYDFLKKYGVSYLEQAEKQIREITDEEYNNINNLLTSIGKKL